VTHFIPSSGSHCLRYQGSIPGYVIGGIVVGIGEYLLYNTVNKAGANSSRVVREPLLAEAMAARRRDSRFQSFTSA
jgi:hypothetical protein